MREVERLIETLVTVRDLEFALLAVAGLLASRRFVAGAITLAPRRGRGENPSWGSTSRCRGLVTICQTTR